MLRERGRPGLAGEGEAALAPWLAGLGARWAMAVARLVGLREAD